MASRQTSILTSVGDDKIEVREATPGDYEEICAINQEVYDGIDYIPALYHRLIANPAVHFYVMLKNDQIIGFKGLMIAPSKNHFISMALRVAPSEQGKGLLGVLQKNSKGLFLQKNPDMTKMMSAGVLTKGLNSYANKNEKAQIKFKRNYHLFKIHSAMAVFNNFLADQGAKVSTELETKRLSALDIRRHLTQATIDKLMPEKVYAYLSMWILEITDEKFMQESMADESVYVLGSFKKSTGEITSLSQGHLGGCVFGDLYNLHYNGNDLTDFVNHVTSHVRHLTETSPQLQNVGLMIYFPKSILPEDVERVLSLLGKPEISTFFSSQEFVIIEEEC